MAKNRCYDYSSLMLMRYFSSVTLGIIRKYQMGVGKYYPDQELSRNYPDQELSRNHPDQELS